jgi:hypothetical protein
MRAIGIVLGAVIALGASTARADESFERKAAGAAVVKTFDEVVWALTASCDQGDELQQRQCRLVRDARAHQVEGATLLVEADPGAFVAGPWSSATRSLHVRVDACIRCGGVSVDGRTWALTGSIAHLDGGKLATELLYDNTRQFSDQARATAWLDSVKHARTQLVLKVPDKRRWQVGGKDGLLFDIVAWRVVQPCTGEVVVASAPSGAVAPDKTACVAPAPAATVVPASSAPEVIEALTREMVRDAMKPVVQGARACYVKYKAGGAARLEIEILADGSVGTYTQTGDFKGSPTGVCIDAGVRNLVFPKSRRPSTNIGYPIVLP